MKTVSPETWALLVEIFGADHLPNPDSKSISLTEFLAQQALEQASSGQGMGEYRG